MEDSQLCDAIRVARAAERMGVFGPSDWPELATLLLVDGREEPEILDLACLLQPVSGWETEPLVTRLIERMGLVEPTDANDAVNLLARLMADDLRRQPASVSAPMIRLLARFAPPSFVSDLANECWGKAEYLDCNCVADLDPRFELELEALQSLALPDGLVETLAKPLRGSLPTVQPPHDH